jgi:hypothetical protein
VVDLDILRELAAALRGESRKVKLENYANRRNDRARRLFYREKFK